MNKTWINHLIRFKKQVLLKRYNVANMVVLRNISFFTLSHFECRPRRTAPLDSLQTAIEYCCMQPSSRILRY